MRRRAEVRWPAAVLAAALSVSLAAQGRASDLASVAASYTARIESRADTRADAGAHGVHFTRGDAWFGLAAAVATGAAAFADIHVREQALASDGEFAHDLARVMRHVPVAAAAGVVVGYAAGAVSDRPGLKDASRRVGASMLVAGIATAGIKVVVGRVRPDESASETDTYQPFSGHGSFPSGHAALAFAAATALDRETRAGWVPWVAYPIAGLVGWSRVLEDRHWASDVVAGAALGTFLAHKTEDLLRARDGVPVRLGLGLDAGGRMRLSAKVTF